MTIESAPTNANLPATMEISNLMNEARKDAGFERRLIFNKGEYFIDGTTVKLGTRMVASPLWWVKKWVKFVNKAVVESRVYHPAKKEIAPEREQMPDTDKSQWPRDGNREVDPWVLYYIMPMLNLDTEESLKFSTYSKGGYRAIGDLVTDYGKRAYHEPKCGLPIVRLQVALMPTSSWGKVQRPHFPIVEWSDYDIHPTREASDEAVVVSNGEFNDEIPF